MTDQSAAPPAADPISVEDKLASFDFDAPQAPAGEPAPKEAGDDEAIETLAGETTAEPAAQPEDDDPETTLRDGTKVRISELKRSYRPDWEKQVKEFEGRQRAFAQATQGFTQAQQQTAYLLQQAVQYVSANMPKEPDAALSESDPFEYQRQKVYYDKKMAELDKLRTAQHAHFQRSQYQQAQAFAKRVMEQREAVLQAMPELKDKVRATKFIEDVKNLGAKLGYTPSELNQIHDARLVKLIARALKADEYEQALAKAKDKIAKTRAEATNAAEVQAPQRRRTQSQVQSDQLRARMERLRKNPNSAKAAEDVLNSFS